jgi:SAM-dependent methyltransferase
LNVRVWERLAELAEIASGVAALDVGCGDGGFCAFVAGRGARAHGIDSDAGQLAQARQVAPSADLRLGLMEELPWADGAFDVVTGLNSFQYALDVELALRESRRVTRAGGRIVVCKWDRPRHNEFFAFLATLGDGIDLEQLPPDPVEAAARRAGLAFDVAGDLPASIDFPDGPSLAAAMARAGNTDEPERVIEAAGPYRLPDGAYRFGNRLMYRIARA